MEEDSPSKKPVDATKAEENYFDKESDDEDAGKPAAADEKNEGKGDKKEAGKEDAMEEDRDEEVDPLDAYMKDVTKEVTQLEEEDKKRSTNVADLDSVMNLSKTTERGTGKSKSMQGMGVRIEVDDSIPDLDEEEKRKEEEFDIKQWLESKNQAKNLRPVDHKAMDYMPFRKNFYIEVPEIAKMSDEQVKQYRSTLDGIKVRGKRCPNPINSWFQCGLSDRTLAVIKKLGWKKPTAIQCQALPVIMSGRDCIGVAKTGSGKTASYLLPCFRHVADQPPIEQGDGPVAIVFTPARELCVQVRVCTCTCVRQRLHVHVQA
jgi:ATP-dependent RNA helicase DDX46/PRP5